MCGIAVICGLAATDDEAIVRMVQAIRHRGPDAQTYRQLDGCHLGHARLSIIDLDNGAQPMVDMRRRRWIVFNGEIYNYRELRQELDRFGYRFATHSDTEVILAAYDRWGENRLDRLRGMYAFAIWDVQTRELFAARDIFGEKPLYYSTAGGRLIVGSEIKAIMASGMVSHALSPAGIDGYLALGYVPPDRTVYEDVQTLPPGHCLVWKAHALHIRRYWSPRAQPVAATADEAGEELRRLLRQAVQRQMIADVPLGAFLSGGHDSSAVVALMREARSGPLQTFSVGFGEHVNELPYARQVAKRYDTEHHELDLADPPVASLLERMAEVYDEPFMDPSHVPTFVLSEFARRRVKVALTGDGADELYGGYAWYPLVALSTTVPSSAVAWFVLRATSRLLADRYRSLSTYSRAMGMAVRWPDAWRRYVRYRQVFSDAERRALFAGNDAGVQTFPNDFFRPDDDIAGLNRALHFDLTAFLPGDILVKVDRAAMAHGLETRAPFLDRELVEFALSLPPTLKVDARQTKILFKQALAPLWPEAIRTRPKQGFAGPFAPWLRRDDVQRAVQRVLNAASPLSQLLPGIDRRRVRMSPQRTWSLLTLGLWLERHGRTELAGNELRAPLAMAGAQ